MGTSILTKLAASGISASEHIAAFVSSQLLKSDFSDYCELETSDADPHCLVTGNGAILTCLRFDGVSTLVGPEEFEHIMGALSATTSSLLRRQGHEIEFQITRDPERVGEEIGAAVGATASAAQRIGLDVSDLLNERQATLSRWCASESSFIALWTTPALLANNEREAESKALRDALSTASDAFMPGFRSQNVMAASRTLRDRHGAFVKTILDQWGHAGLVLTKLDLYQAGRAIREQFAAEVTHKNWRLYVLGDRVPVSYRRGFFADEADLQMPRVSQQLMSVDAEEIDRKTVKIGNKYYAPMHMEHFPQQPDSFNGLWTKLIAHGGLPFRVMLRLTPEGMKSIAVKRALSSFLAWGPMTQNKQIHESARGLKALADAGANIAGVQMAFTTWADDLQTLASRRNTLLRTVESWGDGQLREPGDDPIGAVVTTMAGVTRAKRLPIAAAEVAAVTPFIPLRPASLWQNGALPFRSVDGKLMPWQPASAIQSEFTIAAIIGPPGYGKSVALSAMAMACVLSTKGGELPYLSIIERGPSAAGFVDLVRSGVPQSRRHQVTYIRLQNSKKFAVNFFDTQLGFRRPLPLEASNAVNMLCLFATPPGEGNQPMLNAPSLAKLIVEEAYDYFEKNPKRYEPHVDSTVDKAIEQTGITVEDGASWWEITDSLFATGDLHGATLAQRHAVPSLLDVPKILQLPKIRSSFNSTQVVETGETLLDAMQRVVIAASREYPALSDVTTLDVGEARIMGFDLNDVSSGTSVVDKHQGAIFLLMAMFLSTRQFYFHQSYVPLAPELYREHHSARAIRLKQMGKATFMDEYHKFRSISPAVHDQVVTTAREGRKQNISFYLASQAPDDFAGAYLDDLANSVFILGAKTERAAQKSAEIFGLTDSTRDLILNYCRPPGSGGSTIYTHFTTSKGVSAQLLTLTVGPIELWAYSTTPSDASLRDLISTKMSAANARIALALKFPSGSASSEFERRQAILESSGFQGGHEAMQNHVLTEIAKEVEQSMQAWLNSRRQQ